MQTPAAVLAGTARGEPAQTGRGRSCRRPFEAKSAGRGGAASGPRAASGHDAPRPYTPGRGGKNAVVKTLRDEAMDDWRELRFHTFPVHLGQGTVLGGLAFPLPSPPAHFRLKENHPPRQARPAGGVSVHVSEWAATVLLSLGPLDGVVFMTNK